jgi:hypothetical protein
MIDQKRIANNILDFLIDPTKVPVMKRVYFRPEENLQNQIYEKAKADALMAYRDQKHNSDFYPQKNRSLNKEATSMDRRSLIASLDVLSKNFSDKDPISTDLRAMATAVSQMSDEELAGRLAESAPELEQTLVEAAETFKCPECGTKVLKQTGYCVKCKEKVKPKSAADETAPVEEKDKKEDAPKEETVPTEDKEAFLSPMVHQPSGQREPGSSALPGGGKIKSIYDQHKDEITKSPWLKELMEGLMGKKASDDFWSKEASELVAENLVYEIVGTDEEPEPEEEKKEDKEAAKACPDKKEEVKEEKEAAKACTVPEKKKEDKEAAKTCPTADKKEEEPKEEKKAAENKKEDKKDVPSDKESKVVDTDVLASVYYEGIELQAGDMGEVGELSAKEKEELSRLF